jgi:hypothetical protein
LNYHDLEKAREAARNIPGGSSGGQAARNTGPVIRIVSARRREKLIMARLLAETNAIEKPELRPLPDGTGEPLWQRQVT